MLLLGDRAEDVAAILESRAVAARTTSQNCRLHRRRSSATRGGHPSAAGPLTPLTVRSAIK